jgi:hypothetical protein
MSAEIMRAAASVYDAWRNRGESPEDAMQAAVRVVRANERGTESYSRYAIPSDARQTIEAVALSHGMDTARLRVDGSSTVVRVRSEAVYIARALGDGTPSFPELGAYLVRDHSSLVAADQKFRRRLETDESLRARVGRWIVASHEGSQLSAQEVNHALTKPAPGTAPTPAQGRQVVPGLSREGA